MTRDDVSSWWSENKKKVALAAGVIIIVLTGTTIYFDNVGTKHTSETTPVVGTACTPEGAQARTIRSKRIVCRNVSGSLKWRAILPWHAPTLPTQPTPPVTVRTINVPNSFYATGPCTLPHATTFGRGQWDAWLGTLTAGQRTGTIFNFPAGCYYIDSEGFAFGNSLDGTYPLVDDVMDGSAGAQLVQTNLPDCNTGHSLLFVANQNTHRFSFQNFEMIGTAPNVMPYCGQNPGGFATSSSGSNPAPSDILIVGNDIHNFWGDGIYIGLGNRDLVYLNTITWVGRDSVSPVGGDDVTIIANTMDHAAGDIVDAEANPNSVDVNRLLVDSNVGNNAATNETGTAQNNGLLWSVLAADNTTVSDVTFRNNTSSHALLIDVFATATGAAMNRVSIYDNTSTSNAGQLLLYGNVNQAYEARNKLTGAGPPVGLTNAGGTFTNNPPTQFTFPFTVCGKDANASNTYRTGGGATTAPFRAAIFGIFPYSVGYILPPC